MYLQRLAEEFPNLSQGQIDESVETNLCVWFMEYNKFLRSLAGGPLIGATNHSVYFVNGYKFHTNCHVEYREAPFKQTVLFKYEWFDPTMDVGVKRHSEYNLADINIRRRYKKYEPFILAMQATQVCYVSYPCKKKDKDDCVAVLMEVATTIEMNVPSQIEEVEVHNIDTTASIDENILLHDPNGDVIEMDEPIDDSLLEDIHKNQE
ncbi:hypothetical protein R3W88_024293 [Solanum pinnatisectum]|uniref:DUF4216 domain-containing protein n=1 Tax=Solanum pinnatisectum TaxID=50273 RepID=A0AAV9LZU8_9SOLN|nr:hypothetical protein R3W88_024293 [Solanum pinnatisectum]